jgi:hypothetical protein
LALIRQAKAEGRPVYLASASHQRLVESIADYLGEFTGWFASNETTNLAGARKAQQLVETFGEHGFDYVGNDAADLPVWRRPPSPSPSAPLPACERGLRSNARRPNTCLMPAQPGGPGRR